MSPGVYDNLSRTCQTSHFTEEIARRIALLASLKIALIDNKTTAEGLSSTTLIGELESPFFSRWYIHCQFGNITTIDQVATVFGLALPWHPSVVLTAITGRLSSEAAHYVHVINRTGSTRFVALDDQDLQWIGNDQFRFSTIVEQKSRMNSVRNAWTF